MTLRELALTMPCGKCGAKPGEMCTSAANVGRSVKGQKFFISHKDRMSAARSLKEAQHPCVVPLQWRFTVTLALRALIRSCHASNNEQGCQVSLQCARELGLDVETVKQYTHLEKKEDGNAK